MLLFSIYLDKRLCRILVCINLNRYHTEMSLFRNLAPYSCPLNINYVIIGCHCAVPGYIIVFSVNNRQLLVVENLEHHIGLGYCYSSSPSDQSDCLLQFSSHFSFPWPCSHLPLHHLICRVELLCLPIKLCSCKNFHSSGRADSFFSVISNSLRGVLIHK